MPVTDNRRKTSVRDRERAAEELAEKARREEAQNQERGRILDRAITNHR